jgi:phosphoglycerate kinase
MKTIDLFNFKGKKALVRVDFNVPLDKNFLVTDDSRIVAAIPSIEKILSDNGAVILMSHLGRPKNGTEEKFSLRHLVHTISSALNRPVKFTNDCIGKKAKNAAKTLKNGEVLLLENLRFYSEEKTGDKYFAEQLASLGDIFVNEAFGTAHRAHASNTVITDFFENKKCFGYLMANEISMLEKILHHGKHPITAILGGAKVSSKITIIKELINKVDRIIIGGGMSFTFVKALGGKIGDSLVEEDKISLALSLISEAKEKNVSFLIPVDSLNANAFSDQANTYSSAIGNVKDGWMGLDLGEKTRQIYREAILDSKTILWNGPMGVFEIDKFANGTKFIAEAIVEATSKGSFSLVGGGDSVAAIKKFKMQDQVTYVSTGGGAMLKYLEGKNIPGIKSIYDE